MILWSDTMVWYYGENIMTYSRYCLALFDPAIHSPSKLAQCSCRHLRPDLHPSLLEHLLLHSPEHQLMRLSPGPAKLELVESLWRPRHERRNLKDSICHVHFESVLSEESQVIIIYYLLRIWANPSPSWFLTMQSLQAISSLFAFALLCWTSRNILSISRLCACVLSAFYQGSVGERCCIAPKGWIYVAELAAFHAPAANRCLPCGRALHRLPCRSFCGLPSCLFISVRVGSTCDKCYVCYGLRFLPAIALRNWLIPRPLPLHMQGWCETRWICVGLHQMEASMTSLRNWWMRRNPK